MNVGSLFSGIGGFDLGLERAGMRVVWQCEANEYRRDVLALRFPGVPCYPDVRNVGADTRRVDLICGGFPCQSISHNGHGLVQADERWLWPEFARVIGLLRPRFILLENVAALIGRGFDEVITDLAALRYDAEWDCIQAAAVGAPHRRERLFLVAYSEPLGCEAGPRVFTRELAADLPQPAAWSGVPDRNADGFVRLVPQIAEWIGRRLMQAEALRQDSEEERAA